ncbi:heavy-metal-associated domain-containing protein [Subsaxibacter sp. CAU 1640]|uniref:heavy-metal-associated domain-containing protein n=1 Tax=Subsaxibacter sp. CAU 1640 TaxID=2933271 RepID=UPI002004562F|nr:heavy-metal-associated domain-containing protein [Subsaxibacter sp. CAU 1640]MCK7590966.1 heavy-metal-associated domain-containing protein [Subsaxibacter sp. CAU 1640]
MSFLSENVIPGNYGKKFTTDAKHPDEFKQIEENLMKLDGVKDVMFENGSKPTVFVIHTNKVVTVKAIEDKVKELELHAVPTGPFFPLA